MRGKLIALEGGEGAGKSTQAQALQASLEEYGVPVVRTREPGGTYEAEQVRKLLLDTTLKWEPIAEALLFFAARAQVLKGIILPALDRGCWVIADRFVGSSFAYQGAARNLGIRKIAMLVNLTPGMIGPDLSIYLDIDPEEGLRRAKLAGKDTSFEREPIAFHHAVRSAYGEYYMGHPTAVRIDASLPQSQVESQIWAAVRSRLLPQEEI